MFDFRDMLLEYSIDIDIIHKTEGQWNTNTGMYEQGETTKEKTSAPVLPLTNDDLVNDQSGKYTNKDKKLYLHTDIKQNQEVEINNEIWTVMEIKDYSYHANNLKIAIIRKVGATND